MAKAVSRAGREPAGALPDPGQVRDLLRGPSIPAGTRNEKSRGLPSRRAAWEPLQGYEEETAKPPAPPKPPQAPKVPKLKQPKQPKQPKLPKAPKVAGPGLKERTPEARERWLRRRELDDTLGITDEDYIRLFGVPRDEYDPEVVLARRRTADAAEDILKNMGGGGAAAPAPSAPADYQGIQVPIGGGTGGGAGLPPINTDPGLTPPTPATAPLPDLAPSSAADSSGLVPGLAPSTPATPATPAATPASTPSSAPLAAESPVTGGGATSADVAPTPPASPASAPASSTDSSSAPRRDDTGSGFGDLGGLGGGNFGAGDVMGLVSPFVNMGVGLASGIGSGIGNAISGFGSALGSGLGNMLTGSAMSDYYRTGSWRRQAAGLTHQPGRRYHYAPRVGEGFEIPAEELLDFAAVNGYTDDVYYEDEGRPARNFLPYRLDDPETGEWDVEGLPAQRDWSGEYKYKHLSALPQPRPEGWACPECGSDHRVERTFNTCPECGYDEVPSEGNVPCTECDHWEDDWFDDRAPVDYQDDWLWEHNPERYHRERSQRDPYD